MTRVLSARMETGTAPNTLSSVTHDQTDHTDVIPDHTDVIPDHTDVIPPFISCSRTVHSPSSGLNFQK